MTKIKKYKRERLHAMVLLLAIAAIMLWSSIRGLQDDYGTITLLFLMLFANYVSLNTKIEIFKDLEQAGIKIAELPVEKKIITPNLIFLIIMGIIVIGITAYFANKISSIPSI